MAIRHVVKNFAVVGGLTQRIKLLEKRKSEFENSEKIKEVIVPKEAVITKLEGECQAKDRSIEFLTTRNKEIIDTCEKKSEEQTQEISGAKKALEFDHSQGAELNRGLDEKVKTLNKMFFDMGSGLQLPLLKDSANKINFLGQQLEDL